MIIETTCNRRDKSSKDGFPKLGEGTFLNGLYDKDSRYFVWKCDIRETLDASNVQGPRFSLK